MAEVNDIVWDWNPIGVDDLPRDEYDCIVGPLVSLLVLGAATEELQKHLNELVAEHFGLSPDRRVPEIAARLRTWFNANWKR